MSQYCGNELLALNIWIEAYDIKIKIPEKVDKTKTWELYVVVNRNEHIYVCSCNENDIESSYILKLLKINLDGQKLASSKSFIGTNNLFYQLTNSPYFIKNKHFWKRRTSSKFTSYYSNPIYEKYMKYLLSTQLDLVFDENQNTKKVLLQQIFNDFPSIETKYNDILEEYHMYSSVLKNIRINNASGKFVKVYGLKTLYDILKNNKNDFDNLWKDFTNKYDSEHWRCLEDL